MNRLLILLVELDPDSSSSSYKLLLEALGHIVVIASSAEDAFRLSNRVAPDLAFLLGSAGESGFAKELERRCSSARVLVLDSPIEGAPLVEAPSVTPQLLNILLHLAVSAGAPKISQASGRKSRPGALSIEVTPNAGRRNMVAAGPQAKIQGEKFLYSRKEAASSLGISVRSLDTLVANKRLDTRRLGRKVMIPTHELRKIARQNTYTLGD